MRRLTNILRRDGENRKVGDWRYIHDEKYRNDIDVHIRYSSSLSSEKDKLSDITSNVAKVKTGVFGDEKIEWKD